MAVATHAHTLKNLLAMFHADTARQLALELEQAAVAPEGISWAIVPTAWPSLSGNGQVGTRAQGFVESRGRRLTLPATRPDFS